MRIQDYTIIPQWYPVVLNLSKEKNRSVSHFWGGAWLKILVFLLCCVNYFRPLSAWLGMKINPSINVHLKILI